MSAFSFQRTCAGSVRERSLGPRAGCRPSIAFAATMCYAATLLSNSCGAEPDHSGIRFLGSVSCAATACHGGSGEERRTGGEYGIWLQRDPHARAQSILLDRRSQQMGKQLGIAAVQNSERCTECHATDGPTVPEIDRSTLLSFGVGCESCHGPAERWIEPHKRLEWNNPAVWSDEQKAALGYRLTKDPLVRAETCAGCHIGGPGRDMNHDLIAAGHPRLSFEFSSYHARLPKHWGRSEDLRRNSPVLEARLWLVGQAASLDTSLALLEERARNPANPWPEFSEYACAKCHHQLAASPKRARDATISSAYTWNSWHQALAPFLSESLELLEPGHSEQLRSSLAALRNEMELLEPSRTVVQERIAVVRTTLRTLTREGRDYPYDVPQVRQLSLRLAREGKSLIARDWDSSAQLFLGLSAMHYAEAEATGQYGALKSPYRAEMTTALKTMQRQLGTRDGIAARQLGTEGFKDRVFKDLSRSLSDVEILLSQPDRK
ncbi:MAG: hypothetical protein IT428_22605 [Planctomycetaceae bacterium]|nr:hypothetical protein [Planctomycetaceae bacterium]